MITDRENTFFDNLLPNASATPFGDVVAINNRQYVPGLFAYVQAETPVNNATSLRLEFVSATDAALTTGVTVHYDTGVVTLANFNAAQRYSTGLPGNIPQAARYLGWRLTVAGTAPTLGGLTGGIVEEATLESLPRPAYQTGLT